jgi:diguanylate cyclase (GGDEF)-like protein/PAS domain S-box-containing protein
MTKVIAKSGFTAPRPPDEALRLRVLGLCHILDRTPIKQLEDLAKLAASACSAPIALISIVGADRVLFKAKVGVDLTEARREVSFCSWAILGKDMFVVPDALEDVRFANNPLVLREGIRFYAGMPLVTTDGQGVGTLCVLDRQPRKLEQFQIDMLKTLSTAIARLLEVKRRNTELERALADKEEALKSLTESQQQFNLIMGSTNDGLWDWNLETNRIEFCPRSKEMLSLRPNGSYPNPREWFKRVHPEDVEQLESDIVSHLLGLTGQFQNEHRLRHANGDYRWMLTRGRAVWDDERGAYRMAGSLTDVTERKRTERELIHNAFHDPLTRLPNRAVFLDRLQRCLDRAECHDKYLFAVLFLDLDRFKAINDSLGHPVGDDVLIQVGRKLESSVRPGDMVARLGGDEFAMILDRIQSPEEASEIARRVQNELANPFSIGGRQVYITASLGIALNTTPCSKPEELLANADSAMYRAKRQRRGSFEIFDDDMSATAAATVELENDLRLGLLRGEFRVLYQPIISMADWRITGVEALIRWQHPKRGLILPLKFIPLAEETGLIIPIGLWVLREACEQLSVWQHQFPCDPSLSMSVNLSGRQFSQPGLISRIRDILADTGIAPDTLKVEITESAIIENIGDAAEILSQLKALGVKISLDDFGTGYSSLSYLQRFPIDTLKIDRSFVTRTNSQKDMEILRAIIALAKNLGMDVIAEGVETREQLTELSGLNCEFVQGYLLSHPIDSEAMSALIHETNPVARRSALGPFTSEPMPERFLTAPAIPFQFAD